MGSFSYENFFHASFCFDRSQKIAKGAKKQSPGLSPPSKRLFRQSAAAPEGLFQIREERSCDEEEETDYYYSDPDQDDAEN